MNESDDRVGNGTKTVLEGPATPSGRGTPWWVRTRAPPLSLALSSPQRATDGLFSAVAVSATVPPPSPLSSHIVIPFPHRHTALRTDASDERDAGTEKATTSSPPRIVAE
jgi:hypothetical protein